MGGGDQLQGKAYTRFLSENIRKWSPKSGARFIEEDPIIGGVSGLARCVMLTVCRNRQRLLQQAWDTWTTVTEVQHDYASDMHAILSHPLKDTEMRSELEIEVMYKWVRQNAYDVTGIANNIISCTSKKVICNCLQHLRLESFQPGDPILYQGALPKDEDGHLTILAGSVDVVKFPVDSISFIKLQQYAKRCMYESARRLLLDCTVLATLETNAGFGELSTLTGVKRAVTIRASITNKKLTDVLVIPKEPFMECLEHRRGTTESDDSSPSEAIELFRQTGLAARINPQDLVSAATSMKKINLTAGELLYTKGEKADRLFLVVSGDIALDTLDPAPYNPPGKIGKPLIEPFLSSNEEHVFSLSGGSILGDEGILGMDDRYVASAAVASDRAVVFEALGFSRKFLHDRVKAMRYAALVYKELPRWTVPIPEAESNNLYGYLNSLRRVMSVCRPSRGVSANWHIREEELDLEHFAEVAPMIREIKKKKALERRNNSRKDGVVGDGDREKQAALASKKKKEQLEKKRLAAASKAIDSQRRENMKKRRSKKRGAAAAAMTSGDEEGNDQLYKDAAGNVLDTGGSSFYRLSIPGFNAAKSLNAASKKLQNESVQIHARNHLLQDQLLREAAADDLLEASTVGTDSGSPRAAGSVKNSKDALITNLRSTVRSPEATMVRNARKHQVQELTEKFNEALALYHARQEKYINEEKVEEEEVLRVAEAANMVSMFKQAAAGAINDENSVTGEQSKEVEDFDIVTDSFIEGIHDTNMTAEGRIQAALIELQKPRVEQYLNHILRLEATSRKKTEVENVDMSVTFAASGDENDASKDKNTQDSIVAKSKEDDFAVQELLELKKAAQDSKDVNPKTQAAEQTRLLLGKDWEKSGMPIPEVINPTYWRPPSSPSTKREAETGGLVPLLSPTHSRPTTQELKDLRPSSPWKKREYTFHGVSSDDKSKEEGGTKEASLESLRYDENHYKTHAARMKLVPSSGYGQQHIEAAAQKALGMSLKEFNSINSFYRVPPPNGIRRIVLPQAIMKMRNTNDDISKGAKKNVDDNDPLHNLMRRTGHLQGIDTQFSSWSIDLASPEGFLSELHKKDFSKRREFLVRNGWNTRAMRVTDNSRPVFEQSAWLQEDFQKLTAREKMEAKRLPSPRKARALERERRRKQEEEEALWATLELGAQSANMVVTDDGEEGEDDNFSTGEQQPILARQHSSKNEMCEEEKGTSSDKESNPPSRGEPVEGPEALHTAKSFVSQTSANSSTNNMLDNKSNSRSSMAIKKAKKKVEEAPCYHEAKLPSGAIRAHQEAQAVEYSSRKFLDGKKKNHSTSKFKLAPVSIEKSSQPGDTTFVGSVELLRATELQAARENDKALIASLVPQHVSMLRALDKIQREQMKKEREREVVAMGSGVLGADSTGPELTSSPQPAAADPSLDSPPHNFSSERDIHLWQNFSIQEAVKSKRGPQKTLPVLSLKGTDPLLKPPKKSSLKYGGAMAKVEGYDEISFKPVSSYLDVITRSLKGNKKDRKLT